MKWIDVEKEKPTEEGIYITTTLVGSYNVKVTVRLTRFRIRPAYSEFSDHDWHKTTHWMPYTKGQDIDQIQPAPQKSNINIIE
ncbi:hypothetical protein AB4254_11540 [Vibrio breoganii]